MAAEQLTPAQIAELTPAQIAGLSSIEEALSYDTLHPSLTKIFGNILSSPAEAKYRRLRTANEKVSALVSARGVRQLLKGSGFVEEEGALLLPEAADLSPLCAAAAALRAQHEQRVALAERQKAEAVRASRAQALRQRRKEEPPASVAQAHASHILLKATDEAAAARLAALKLEIADDPAQFARSAREHSECPSGARGGSLSFFARGKMVDEFDELVFSQPVGAVYGPLRTSSGLHLIFLHARIDAAGSVGPRLPAPRPAPAGVGAGESE
jgi:peptidyl-prolyl cis-trans isomerase C